MGVKPHKPDDIAFDPESGSARPLSVRAGDIELIAAQPCWITERVYLWWTERLLTLSDLIVWLDVPMRVALFRKIPHHLQRSLSSLTGRYPHAGMRNQVDHTLFVWRYYMNESGEEPAVRRDDRLVNRSPTAQSLEPFTAKVVRFHTTDDVDVLFGRIS